MVKTGKPTREELIAGILQAQELLKRQARVNFKKFVLYTKEDYDPQWFHSLICEKLDAFERGEIKKMMIFLPPQHGKSELTTRKFPAYLMGKNPKTKVGIVSYNSTIAGGFNRSIQRTIDSLEYLELFPKTKLNESKFHNDREQDKQRSMEQIDILGTEGSIKTIGRGGSLTGFPLDIGIIDDPIKDREEAMSETVRAALYNWYVDVFKTRLHNNSQQLIIQTRWHEHDLAGQILAKENDWVVIKLPALRTRDVNDYDPREEGQALWPARHSRESIEEIKLKNQVTFNSLYQQDPKPNTEILVYKDWIEIPQWPPQLTEFSWGLDFGKTTGINALLRGTVTSAKTKMMVTLAGVLVEVERNNAYLEEIHYAAGTPVKELAKLLFANGYREGQVVWCDHVPTKIFELRTLGISAMPAIKGPGSVSAGIDKMNEYQVYFIGANMKMETSKYQYVTYDTLITNEPVDAFNHLLDAARYCLLSRFFKERE